MKPSLWLATLVACSSAATVVVDDSMITPAPATATGDSHLEKRYRNVVINKDYKKEQELKAKIANGENVEETTDGPKNWLRTIYDTKVEIVRPTVIAGVTFSAQPPETPNGLEPWISLNKDGSPKTIKPQLKNGHTKNASPTYGTWFATPTTKVYTKEELKAHNMADDEEYVHVEYIPEDQTYHSLNPLIRCTPDNYANKGLAKDVSSEPFCFPRDNAELKLDKTYFVTWFSRYFEGAKKVRLHLSHIRETAMHKGMKREDLGKRSSVIEKGGTISKASFYVSDWVSNDSGYLPFEVDEEWLGKDYYKKVLLSIQPDTVKDEDFDLMEKHVVIQIARGAKVSKGSNLDLKKQEEKLKQKLLSQGYDEIEEGIDYEKYIAILAMPTCVALAALGMYFFVFINRKNTDLSFLKKRKFARKNTTHRKIPLKKKTTSLPQFSGDIELSKRD